MAESDLALVLQVLRDYGECLVAMGGAMFGFIRMIKHLVLLQQQIQGLNETVKDLGDEFSRAVSEHSQRLDAKAEKISLLSERISVLENRIN